MLKNYVIWSLVYIYKKLKKKTNKLTVKFMQRWVLGDELKARQRLKMRARGLYIYLYIYQWLTWIRRVFFLLLFFASVCGRFQYMMSSSLAWVWLDIEPRGVHAWSLQAKKKLPKEESKGIAWSEIGKLWESWNLGSMRSLWMHPLVAVEKTQKPSSSTSLSDLSDQLSEISLFSVCCRGKWFEGDFNIKET